MLDDLISLLQATRDAIGNVPVEVRNEAGDLVPATSVEHMRIVIFGPLGKKERIVLVICDEPQGV